MTSMSHLTQYQMETLMSHQHLIRSEEKDINESSPSHNISGRGITELSPSHTISEKYQRVITISQGPKKRHQ